MKLKETKLLYEAGKLKEAIIESCQENNGWIVVFTDDHGDRIILTNHTGQQRLFKDLDTATRITNEIGFHSVRIEERF
jgi:gamma-glutamyl phosphate reductase